MKSIEVQPLIKGLQRDANSEYIEEDSLRQCDGMLVHKGVVRKDWSLILSGMYIDPMRYRELDELAKCSSNCPEYGNDVETGGDTLDDIDYPNTGGWTKADTGSDWTLEGGSGSWNFYWTGTGDEPEVTQVDHLILEDGEFVIEEEDIPFEYSEGVYNVDCIPVEGDTRESVIRVLAEKRIDYLKVPACCTCEDVSIGYTTAEMQCGEEQVIWIIGYEDYCTYTWEVNYGEITYESGMYATFKAGSSNPFCMLNPTIRLKCNGAQVATLYIMVNCYIGSENAYAVIQDCNYANCVSNWCTTEVVRKFYKCNGTYDSTGGALYCDCNYQCPDGLPCTCEDNPDEDSCAACINEKFPGSEVGSVIDLRTELMIAYGCCPEAVL